MKEFAIYLPALATILLQSNFSYANMHSTHVDSVSTDISQSIDEINASIEFQNNISGFPDTTAERHLVIEGSSIKTALRLIYVDPPGVWRVI